MADDVVIHAESLGKKYVIGHQAERESYTALRDVIARTFKGFARSGIDMLRGRQLVAGETVEEFWALKDVSFEIKRGEVVGIIGRNGAGKSTLLKILSRITEPTEGRVTIKGRVASLLEVGTGFHPELTGRENIYLNGAILGMTRAEIKRKFDEIAAFAEVDAFLDTPVKRYSSGMHVRLAFAVAAHLEPEILVIDEVLAVGDAEFQKKSLGKMHDVSRAGRTVLFVSHNLGAVRSLCSGGILLRDGKLVAGGTVSHALELYLQNPANSPGSISDWRGDGAGPGDHTFKVQNVSIQTLMQSAASEVSTDEAFHITIQYEKRVAVRGVRISLRLVTAAGEIAFTTTDHSERSFQTDGPGIGFSTCIIPARLLNVGRYVICLSVDIPGVRVIANWFDGGAFSVSGHHNGGTTFPDNEWPGVVSPRLSWSVGPAHRPRAYD
jgi:lipopolysaccharide transport system ATP-binding protein